MKDRLNKELDDIVFEGKDKVLRAIEMKENQPSFLARLLNYEISIPVPVVAIALSVCLFVTVKINIQVENQIDYIYVISEGGDYEAY